VGDAAQEAALQEAQIWQGSGIGILSLLNCVDSQVFAHDLQNRRRVRFRHCRSTRVTSCLCRSDSVRLDGGYIHERLQPRRCLIVHEFNTAATVGQVCVKENVHVERLPCRVVEPESPRVPLLEHHARGRLGYCPCFSPCFRSLVYSTAAGHLQYTQQAQGSYRGSGTMRGMYDGVWRGNSGGVILQRKVLKKRGPKTGSKKLV
jgi:hypothetical protein